MPLTYKSFCWCLGTTSFRTKNFNRTIEEQLGLLNEFWSKPNNADIAWRNNNIIQTEYYLFMQEKGFVEGDADNKPKVTIISWNKPINAPRANCHSKRSQI